MQGDQIDAVLEAGVCKWPAEEGCFPQVGRLTFDFDGRKPSGQRIQDDSIRIGGIPVEPQKVLINDKALSQFVLEYLRFVINCQ